VVSVAACGPRGREFHVPLCSSLSVNVMNHAFAFRAESGVYRPRRDGRLSGPSWLINTTVYLIPVRDGYSTNI